MARSPSSPEEARRNTSKAETREDGSPILASTETRYFELSAEIDAPPFSLRPELECGISLSLAGNARKKKTWRIAISGLLNSRPDLLANRIAALLTVMLEIQAMG
jgi:hypothetical protein